MFPSSECYPEKERKPVNPKLRTVVGSSIANYVKLILLGNILMSPYDVGLVFLLVFFLVFVLEGRN